FLLFEPGGVIGLVRRSQALVRKFNIHGGEGGEPAEIIDLPSTAAAHHGVGDSTATKGEEA
ncbi:MAG TPA: hypothetical protein VFK47_09370, partial [Ktedonobacteraceae bacterium]|nr:hypothetical protein [Ktedonobacteraceae bacterium]